MFNYRGPSLPNGQSITVAPSHAVPVMTASAMASAAAGLLPQQQLAAATPSPVDMMSVGDAVASWSAAQVAQLLAGRPPGAVNERGWNGLTPLHRACLRGQADIVDCLLARGADIAAATDSGETPFHCAARRGNPMVLDTLLRAGADPWARDCLGKLAAHHAASGGSTFSLLFLESFGAVASGGFFDAPDSAGRTPLHYAVQHDHEPSLSCLLRRRRCSPLIADRAGDTPLHLAARLGRPHLCSLLLLGSATPGAADIGGGGGQKLLRATNGAGRTALGEARARLAEPVPSATMADQQQVRREADNIAQVAAVTTFLLLMGHAKSVGQMKLILSAIWLAILAAPFSLFALALLAARWLPPGQAPYLLTCGTVCSVLFTRTQGHRVGNAARWPNPAHSGAFLGGFLHTAACYFTRCARPDTWLHWSALICLPLFCIMYAALLTRDPGWADAEPQELRPDGKPVTLADLVRERRSLSDSYCQTCERCLRSERTKHCRLCDRCVLDLDHHCLFLMRCVAKRNLWLFAAFMLLAWYGVMVFIVSTWRLLGELYGPLPGLDDNGFFGVHLSNLGSLYHQEPWVFHILLLNLASWLFGMYMNYHNLSNLSMGQTYYFRLPGRQGEVGPMRRLRNLCHFFATGRVFSSGQFAVPFSRAEELM